MAMSSLAVDISVVARARQRRALLALWLFGAGLAAAFLLAVGYGALAIGPEQAVTILAAQAGVELPWGFTRQQEAVLLAIRLPRAVAGILVGAALAASGAALQGLFRNPLADPALIGVSNGAALAAAAMIVLGGSLSGVTAVVPLALLLPLAAFGGGLIAVFLVYSIASRDGRTDVATMLLAGVAVTAMTGAGIGFMVFLSDDQQLRDLNYWMLGSLGGITWSRLGAAAPFILAGTLSLTFFARPLNALLLGESEAGHLGFRVERAKRSIVVMAALAAGAAVALTGVIGFVGLVVPHVVRLVAGPDHRLLLPASILFGAALMLLADLFARTLVLPAELPIGILTACVGGPFFIWLLLRRRGSGGW
ncbi:FecCD family ABC transporter permease [Pelagibius marinus]|uniref:FecCD family ABC transporter permease n=1 Tax=Pelagibius marinus TaxID=2762760 RepID=UPI001D04B793|nr:iron chelate uptake ABC transporter family permease subunit [Pelagibius marinus]